jgi:thiamine biosynthesis lipoprotein
MDSIVVRQSAMDGWSAVKTKSGVLLEEGGFGKGVGLDAALDSLSSASVTSAVLDFGGQVAVLPQHEPVSITIADPDRRGRPILAILIDGGSLSVSGNSEKSFVVAGVRYGHLLNPKNGKPVPDFGSAVVWTERGVWADCLSTALYAMGPAKAKEWARLHPEHGVLLIERASKGRLRVTASDRFRGRLTSLDRQIDLQYIEGE